jgi:uracil-DNA glycosylase
MWFDRLWELLQAKVFSLSSETDGSSGLLNFYSSPDTLIELPQAAFMRRLNLRSWLQSLPELPGVLLVGEAPGWRGCRFSGVPFTSEAQLAAACLPFDGQRTSRFARPAQEATASVFWRELLPYHGQFFAWNVLPIHPHLAGQPLTNRNPGRGEIDRFLPLLDEIIHILKPQQVVAVGSCASQAINRLGYPVTPIRHPARGGAAAFRAGVLEIFAQRNPEPVRTGKRLDELPKV